jgi:Cu2+-exporting ATPase
MAALTAEAATAAAGAAGGKKKRRSKAAAVTLFCGDGADDAVALAQATVGVHINATSDMAPRAADAALLRPSLAGVLDLSRAAVRRIAFNFAWSFTYNLFAILLAAGAFVRARIRPEFAGLDKLVSMLSVILIALQLRWVKFRY